MIRLVVVGTPVTQGSKRAFVVGGRARLAESGGARHKAWRDAVADAARQWQADNDMPGLLAGPVAVGASFALTRPKSHPKTRRTWPTAARSGDVDKLLRACFDSLTGTLLEDDAQVVLTIARKDWGDPPGVTLDIWTAAELADADGRLESGPAYLPPMPQNTIVPLLAAARDSLRGGEHEGGCVNVLGDNPADTPSLSSAIFGRLS